MNQPFDPAIWMEICKAAYNNSVDHALVAAIVLTESSGNPFQARHEPKWAYLLTPEVFAQKLAESLDTEIVLQSTSWGLMQVMGSVARENGFKGWLPQLTDMKLGLQYGIIHLKSKLSKYSYLDAIASYNMGSPKKNGDGTYLNQAYVDKITENQKEFLAVTKPPIG